MRASTPLSEVSDGIASSSASASSSGVAPPEPVMAIVPPAARMRTRRWRTAGERFIEGAIAIDSTNAPSRGCRARL